MMKRTLRNHRSTTSNMAVFQHITPWIEELILSYGTENRRTAGDGGSFMAQIVNVGQMPLSQTQCSAGFTGLIFLSDSVLQIPAVLTSSCWGGLQDQCDLESISSLLNAIVCLRDYELRFHLSAAKSKCRFYLTVADLLMLPSCQVRGVVSCTVLPRSVLTKIDEVWRNLQTQELTAEEELENQELTLLLNEWSCDVSAEALDHVRKKLAANRGRLRLRPSTSSKTPGPPSASTPTDWERDRILFKNHKLFSVPVKCLIIPEEGAPQLQTPASPPAEVSVSPENPEGWTEEVTWPVADSRLLAFTNPWDMFPPPCSASSSNTSISSLTDQPLLETRKPRIRLCPYRPSQASSGTTSVTDIKTSQAVCCLLPVATSSKAQSKANTRLRSPQLPVPNPRSSVSTSVSSRDESLSSSQRPSLGPPGQHLSPASPEPLTSAAATGAGPDQEVAPEPRASKRKKGDAPETPSWDLEKPSCSSTQKESNEKGKNGSMRGTPRGQVHPCGAPFSYTYKTTTQNIQDFRNFKVEKSVLYWAIRYLLNEGEGSTNDHSCD